MNESCDNALQRSVATPNGMCNVITGVCTCAGHVMVVDTRVNGILIYLIWFKVTKWNPLILLKDHLINQPLTNFFFWFLVFCFCCSPPLFFWGGWASFCVYLFVFQIISWTKIICAQLSNSWSKLNEFGILQVLLSIFSFNLDFRTDIPTIYSIYVRSYFVW